MVCFSLPHHRHFLVRTDWRSYWFCVSSLRGTRLATFPGIAFLLKSQKGGGIPPTEPCEQPLLPLELLLCTKEQVLVHPKQSVAHSGPVNPFN